MSSTKKTPEKKKSETMKNPTNENPVEQQQATPFQVTKPKMGEVLQLNKDTYVAVVGGKPTSNWTGLETPMDLSEVTADQHRPMLTNASTKARANRIEGQAKPYESGSKKLKEFVEDVFKHLKDYGMDTIAYVKDPTEENKMTNCVLDYARFTTKTMEKMLVDRFKLYDSYDKKNDKDAVEYLLASVSERLQIELKSGTTEGEERAFASYFAEFIEIERQATATQLRELSDKIRAVKPTDFAGENLKDMWLYIEPLVQELVSCDAFDHNLTDDLGEMLLTSGGTGPEVKRFHFGINQFLEKLQHGLDEITFLEPKKQMAYMKEKKLMPSDLFRRVKEDYRKLFNSGKWPPANNMKNISGSLPMANAVPTGMLQAAANALVQVMNNGNNKGKQQDHGKFKQATKGTCYQCGKPGHFKSDCPQLKGGNRKSNRNNPNKDLWKKREPGPSEPQEKVVNGKKFFWCGSCGRWSTTHSTATHIKRHDTSSGPAANTVPNLRQFVWAAPFCVSASKHGQPDKLSVSVPPSNSPSYLSHWMSLLTGFLLAGSAPFVAFEYHFDLFLTCLHWICDNCLVLLPFILWIIVLALGMAIPWLVPPEVQSRRERRSGKFVRVGKRRGATSPGATRLGYHRSFPLRCRRDNLHLTLPHPRDRWKGSLLRTLFDKVLCFVSRIESPVSSREGDKDNRVDRATGAPFSARIKKDFGHLIDMSIGGTQPKNANSGNAAKHSMHPGKHSSAKAPSGKNAKANFGTKAKAKANFGKNENPGHCHPSSPVTFEGVRSRYNTSTKYYSPSTESSSVYQRRLSKLQRDSVAEVFATPHYFSFIAQDELPSELLILAAKIRAAYVTNGKSTRQLNKEKLLPVIWDSGASVCVSYDPNDFVGPIQAVPAATRLRGFFRNGPRIRGLGYVAWSFEDSTGQLRTLKLPALYVPEVKQRLLSTTCLLKAYPTEKLTVLSDKMHLSGDSERNSIDVPTDPITNLPTGLAYAQGNPDQPQVNVAQFPVASSFNNNLSDVQRELLRWHQRLGHVGYRRVQFLLRSGVLSHTEKTRHLHTAAAKLSSDGCPLCAACQFGKQRRRPAPGKKSTLVKDCAGALSRSQLFPGQRVSADHFICSTRGRLTNTKGKESDREKYGGGCIFVDHATSFIHVELQVTVSATETLQSKIRFETLCRDFGVVPQEYQTDNGSAFTSQAFSQHLSQFAQSIRFAGTGAHHQNGVAERAIQSIMSSARTMLLHAAIHWPEAADPQLWPFAVRHAVYLHNVLPAPDTGLSPSDLFARTRHPTKSLVNLHPLFCPVYALDKTIADGHKLPRWKPRSDRYIFVGFSEKHASTVPLLLNPRTGSVVTNYHVVFDDWFATVPSSVETLPDFGSDSWDRLFGDSEFQYILEESDAQPQPMETLDDDIAVKSAVRSARIASALDDKNSQQYPPLAPPSLSQPPLSAQQREPLAERKQAPTIQESTTPPSLSQPPLSAQQREPLVERKQAPTIQVPMVEPSTITSSSPLSPVVTSPALEPMSTIPSPESHANDLQRTRQLSPAKELRRSSRRANAPTKLSYDVLGDNSPGPQAHFATYLTQIMPDIDLELASAYKASNQDPDVLTFDQAMACDDGERDRWIQAAVTEIRQLESMDCWDEVPIHEATSKILPGTWTFRRKRTPDGEVKKWKGRFCVRGDLQEGEFETFSPLVAWATVRLFLVLSLVLKWKTVSVDFASAFVQAPLTTPIWIHLPRGFRSDLGPRTCLRLKRSLYGLAIAPRLWYQHLFEALLHPDFGLTQSVIDPCLLVSSSLILVTYCDDVGIAAPNEGIIDEFIDRLRKKGFTLEKEGSFEEFLGIKFEYNGVKGTVEMTQKGLISKIIKATGLQSCKPNYTPASQLALGRDDDGESMSESWCYRSIIGMLLYLCTNTRPDISFAVSQAARFSSAPKQSHATAVKTIVRYLAGTADKGMIMQPRGDLRLEMFCDADFAGLYQREPHRSIDSARSRTGYIIKLSGCALVWKSQLQTEISLSTLEAEYSALSQALRTLLPLKRMLTGIAQTSELPQEIQATILADVFEDNQGCLALATNHRLTSRTKYFHVKWHWFWHYYSVHREFRVLYIKSALQDADYLTKQIPKDAFQANRLRTQGW